MSDSESSTGGSPVAVAQLAAADQPPSEQQAQDDVAPAAPAQEDELDTSFFPAPPAYYKLYTSTTLALDATSPERQRLEPPDVGLILQGGSYSVFGETWPVEEVLPSLHELGVRELFDPTAGSSSSSLLPPAGAR